MNECRKNFFYVRTKGRYAPQTHFIISHSLFIVRCWVCWMLALTRASIFLFTKTLFPSLLKIFSNPTEWSQEQHQKWQVDAKQWRENKNKWNNCRSFHFHSVEFIVNSFSDDVKMSSMGRVHYNGKIKCKNNDGQFRLN